MKFKYLILLYFLVPFSCKEEVCQDSCCGVFFERTYSKIDSLSVISGRIDTLSYSNLEEYSFEPVISNSYENAALEIGVKLIGVVESQKRSIHFSLMSDLKACTPPESTPSQMLESITIISDSTISSDTKTFSPGLSLNELFVIAKQFSGQEEVGIDEYIDNQINNSSTFGRYGETLILKLRDYVVFPQNNLTIIIELDDDSIYNLSTEDFRID